MANDKAPKVENPKLIDRTIGDIQDGLIANLNWMDRAFGKCERLVKEINGKKYFTPNIYVKGYDYIPVSPDSKIGNFSFFVVEDPQYLQGEQIPTTTGDLLVGVSLVFWLDLRRIYNDVNNRNTEEIKAEILKLLNGGILVRSGSFKVNRIHERAENIYRGFTLDEVDNQFLMHPFCGFRFEGELRIFENC